jgi:hypothetical protein
MKEKTKWILIYVAAYCVSVSVAYFLALSHLTIFHYTSTVYLLCLSMVVIGIFVAPFFILTIRGFSNDRRRIQKAVGKGFVVWFLLMVFLTGIRLLFVGNIFPITYVLNIIIGSILLRHYKFPLAYIFLVLIFPWLALLYLLIYGELKIPQDKNIVLV